MKTNIKMYNFKNQNKTQNGKNEKNKGCKYVITITYK